MIDKEYFKVNPRREELTGANYYPSTVDCEFMWTVYDISTAMSGLRRVHLKLYIVLDQCRTTGKHQPFIVTALLLFLLFSNQTLHFDNKSSHEMDCVQHVAVKNATAPFPPPPVFDNLSALSLSPWLAFFWRRTKCCYYGTTLRNFIPLSNVLTYEDKTHELIFVKTYPTQSRDCSRETIWS